jgi:GDP-mannose 4,6-dehydratase
MEPKVLITGITGMVGSHLLDYLITNTKWKVFGFVRWRSSFENISSHIEEINKSESRLKLLYGDLNDFVSIANALRISKPDYIFHLAAHSFPLTSFVSPIETLQTNIIGTANLLENIRQIVPNAVTHICSSSEVFGRIPKERLPIKEDENFHPASPYAISKSGTDLLGRFYAEAYGINTQTTRMFTHTGPRRGDVFAESSFAKQIALAESGFIKPEIKVGNLNSLRTVADVRDAVRAYHMLLTINPIPGSYYNIGGNYTCTVGEILDKLISLSEIKKFDIQIDETRLRPIDADLQIPDTNKFKINTGWEPKFTFEQTMVDLLNYWRVKLKLPGNNLIR